MNYGVYKLDPLKPSRALNDPLFLQIEPTNRCNLSCPMCMRDKFTQPRGDMDFQQFQQIISQTRHLYRIHLQGNGEPLLHPRLTDFISYARERGIIVTTITNGTLMTEEKAHSLILSGLNEIQFSLDALDKEDFEKIRIGANFENLKKNIERFIEIKDELKKKIHVSLAVVIQRKNEKAINRYFEYGKKIGIEKISFQYLEPKHDKSYTPQFYEANKTSYSRDGLIKEFDRARKLAKDTNIICDFVPRRTKKCLWPWEGLYITWDGKVSPCCLIFNYFVGNVFESRLVDIWNGEPLKKFRKKLRTGNILSECKGCSHY